MGEVEIKFNEWSRERLRQGKKKATSRRRRYGHPGDYFYVEGRKYRLVRVERVRLEEVAEKYYEIEGAESPEEFRKIWVGIHPRAGWRPEQKVWLHVFEQVNEGGEEDVLEEM